MTELARYKSGALLTQSDLLEASGAFLRLSVADGDASPETARA